MEFTVLHSIIDINISLTSSESNTLGKTLKTGKSNKPCYGLDLFSGRQFRLTFRKNLHLKFTDNLD